jgi:hypothetical protein
MLKRKSTLSYFSGEDNDEEEDEWEREASTSSRYELSAQQTGTGS